MHYRRLREANILMDKAVIFDVFNFVSFHLCKALLDKGIEVEGISIENMINDEVSRMKKDWKLAGMQILKSLYLKIGRINSIRHESKMTIICSIYDIYMTYNEKILIKEAVAYEFIDYFKGHKDKIEQLVLLVPQQILTSEAETEALLAMNDFIQMSEELTDNIQLYYLPTIYGPWQPKTFVFQHTILTKMNKQEVFRGLREETIDALYIGNTVETLLDIMENSDAGRYLFESGLENQWDFCANTYRLMKIY